MRLRFCLTRDDGWWNNCKEGDWVEVVCAKITGDRSFFVGQEFRQWMMSRVFRRVKCE